MKAIVIYGSNFGNTQKIAETIAVGIGCKAVSVDKIDDNELNEVDLLVVGTGAGSAGVFGQLKTRTTKGR